MAEPGIPGARFSEAESRFERVRNRVGLWLAPSAALLVWVTGTDGPARRLAALMSLVAVFWITEAIPLAMTALLAAVGAVLLGVASAKEAFAAFGNPILFLFIGSFFLAEAMRLHGLGERFARALGRLARTRVGVLAALSFAAFSLSLWISNVAATAIALPIALSVAQAEGDRRYGGALVLSIAYGASIGGLGTPIGTPPNLIGLGALHELADVSIGFGRWMLVGVPIALVMLGLLWLVLAWRFRLSPPDRLRSGHVAMAGGDAAARPFSRGERAIVTSFGLAVALWLLPGALELAGAARAADWLEARLPESSVALLCSSLLFLWPIGRRDDGSPRRALEWEQAARIDWGTVLLFGGGILLGDLAGKTGLAEAWGRALVEATGAASLWAITALVTATAILLSEATSNTATATLMVPLAIALARGADVPVVPPALGATLGASFGFMLPISTGPNAMAYGTGQVTIRQMASAGFVFDLLGFLAILGGLRLLCPLLGLM